MFFAAPPGVWPHGIIEVIEAFAQFSEALGLFDQCNEAFEQCSEALGLFEVCNEDFEQCSEALCLLWKSSSVAMASEYKPRA